MKRKEPHNFARLRHVLLPHDYVNYWLTGVYCMEAGDASGTGVPPPPAAKEPAPHFMPAATPRPCQICALDFLMMLASPCGRIGVQGLTAPA